LELFHEEVCLTFYRVTIQMQFVPETACHPHTAELVLKKKFV